MANLTFSQRRRLKSQGRCFTCREKGHRSQDCKAVSDRGSLLERLPVELLEQICLELITPNPNTAFMTFAWLMGALRLTCRAINEKTYRFYHHMAFKTVHLNCSHRSLTRLDEISQHTPAASQIEALSVRAEPPRDEEEYERTKDQLLDTSLSRRERRDAARRLEDADLKDVDKAFMENSAAAGIMLSMAMKKTPKLRRVMLVGQRNLDVPSEESLPPSQRTTSRMFSMVLSSLAFSGVQIQTLEIQHFGCEYPDQGISLRALCLPPKYRSCLSQLSELRLALDTNENSLPSQYPNYTNDWITANFVDTPATISSVDVFLKHTPLLTELWLSFINTDWKDTKAIFGRIAKSVILPRLKRLDLNGMRCVGRDVQHFLRNHQALEAVDFANLDIEGPGTFTNILDGLADLKNLTEFKSRQIAQNGLRTTFPTLCSIEASSSSFAWDSLVREFGEYITYEPMLMVNQFPYCGEAEVWEGVSEKLRDLSRDLMVTGKTYHSDYPGGYVWYKN